MTAIKIFLSSKKVCGLCVAEVNPDHDPGLKMTNMLVDGIVKGFQGRLEARRTELHMHRSWRESCRVRGSDMLQIRKMFFVYNLPA